MFKKFLSLALVVMMLMSVVAISVSAAQVEVAEDGASASVADQGAEGDVASQGAESDVASTGANLINFDNSTTNWSGEVSFYAYCLENPDDKPFGEWGSKKLKGTDEDGDNVWSYDASALQSGNQYCIIFYDSVSGDQTYDLIMDTNCFGDTAYATGNSIENPVDSNKTAKEAKWKSSSLGPRLQVTSIGNVVGETCPNSESKYDMFVNFLKNTLDNARTYSKKDDQTLIDDTAKALGLGKSDVEKAITEAGVTTEWSKDKSTLSDDSSSDVNNKGDGSTSTSSKSSSSSASSSASSKTSTTGSTSTSSKSGSASNTQTGQTETVIFIMLGVMVAAAGVIFFARKKERT